MANTMKPSREIARLIEIMAELRTPVTGCPWDLEQTFETIAPYTIEEAYEVADAIERRDLADLKDELGDLLLQVVYHSRIAEEQGAFAFGDVVEAVTKKMIRRHPHVFGDGTARDPSTVKATWDQLKAEERAEKAAERARLSEGHTTSPQGPVTLADVPTTLPALTRAIKLQNKAAKVGFDWPNLLPVFDKLKEEIQEFEDVALPHDPRGAAAGGRLSAGESPDAIKVAPSDTRSASQPEGAAAGGRLSAGESPDAIKVAPSDTRSASQPEGAAAGGRLSAGESPDAIKEEFGDILFVMANIARHLDINPEDALRGANRKFVRRFAHIEKVLAERGKTPSQSTLEEMDALWDEAKTLEKT